MKLCDGKYEFFMEGNFLKCKLFGNPVPLSETGFIALFRHAEELEEKLKLLSVESSQLPNWDAKVFKRLAEIQPPQTVIGWTAREVAQLRAEFLKEEAWNESSSEAVPPVPGEVSAEASQPADL